MSNNSRSYKELYNKSLLLLECYSIRYDTPSHTSIEWDELIDKVPKKDIQDYIEELKGEEEK